MAVQLYKEEFRRGCCRSKTMVNLTEKWDILPQKMGQALKIKTNHI